MPRKKDGSAPALSPQILAQLGANLEPIRKDTQPIYRGQERVPLLSVRSPASGRFLAHAIDLIGDCSEKRRLESRYPQALRALKGGVPGYILMEPIQVHDPTAPDQYELKWYRGNQIAAIDLLEILQPRNLEVPKGFVSEMPVSLEQINTAAFIVIHTGDATVRPEGAADREQPAEA